MYRLQVEKKGSLTVETTLIMPIVLMVIIAMFFLVLYVYNRGILENAVSRGTKQVFYYENESNQEIERECVKVVMADLEGHLVGVAEPEVKVVVSAQQVEIFMTGKLNVPELLAWEGTVFEEFWHYKICKEVHRINPPDIIQKGQQIGNIVEEVQKDGS